MFYKKIFSPSFLVLLLISSLKLNAQIGINVENPNSLLEIHLGDFNQIDPTKPPGIIVPRVNYADLNNFASNYSINQSAALVYIKEIDTELEDLHPSLGNVNSEGYHYFDGNYWQKLKNETSSFYEIEPWNSSDSNNQANSNTENIYHNAQVGIGLEGEIDPNAILELKSEDKGLIITRLTANQINAIENPTISMLVWNSTDRCFNFYKNRSLGWRSLCGDNGTANLNIINCGSIVAAGEYKVGVAPNPENNYIELSINVLEPGDYTIVGSSAVGIFFEKSGFFPSRGNYIVKLPALGSPTRAGSNEAINLSINGYSVDCEATIDVIRESMSSFEFLSFERADDLEIGSSTMGKTLTLKINVLTEGTFNFITDTNNGIQYKLLNKHLDAGINEITLYSNSMIVPYTFNQQFLFFRLMSDPINFMANPNYVNIPININVINNFAQLSCNNITVANRETNYYVSGKIPFNSDNSITVNVNVTQKGPYLLTATNPDANITFTAQGTFNSIGNQSLKVYASTALAPGDPGNYNFSVDFLGNSSSTSACDFNLDVIYPKESSYMAVYGVGITNKFRNALLDKRNFGPIGKFKIEPLTSTYNSWGANSTIYQSSSNTISPTDLSTFINVYKVRMILITWDVDKDLSDESAAILADFVNNKKGTVFFVNGQRRGNIIKKIIDNLYNTNVVMTTDYAKLRGVTLPNLPNNPYINGVFGNISNKYFTVDDDESWVGVDPNSLGTELNYFANIPDTNNGTYPARKTLLYSEIPGFFLIPDAGALDKTGNNYGENTPIGYNNNNGDNNVNILNLNGSITSGQISTGLAADWVLFGNVMAEYIKYSFQNRNAQP